MSAQQYNLSNARELNAALAELHFKQIAIEVLPALSKMEGVKFKGYLAWRLDAEEPESQQWPKEDAAKVAYLTSITAICNAEVMAGLKRLELVASPEILVETARSFPLSRMFRGAFTDAVKGDSGAKNTLALALAEARRNLQNLADMASMDSSLPAESEPVPPSAPARQPQPHSPTREPRPAQEQRQLPAAPQPRQQERPQPQYESDQPSQASTNAVASGSKFGPSKHVYGGSGALCFQVSMPDEQKGGEWGIHIEGTKGANRQYDWKNKINIRFNEGEIPLFLAVLLGYLPSFEGKAHGPANDKSFSIENQGRQFFVKVRHKDKTVAVPVPLGDAWWLSTMFLKVLMKLTGLSETTLIGLVKTNCEIPIKYEHSQRNAA